MNPIEIGRLLRANTMGFVLGCQVDRIDIPVFGAMVRVPLENETQIIGLIYDIRIQDDGLIRQLVTTASVDDAIIADNRVNRNVPLEISVVNIGYLQGPSVQHMLPPRPPLSLDVIYLCSGEELRHFTSAGRFGYFRHILRARDFPVTELLAEHLKQAHELHSETGNHGWSTSAIQELITLLRDDYQTLMVVLSALADAIPSAAIHP